MSSASLMTGECTRFGGGRRHGRGGEHGDERKMGDIAPNRRAELPYCIVSLYGRRGRELAERGRQAYACRVADAWRKNNAEALATGYTRPNFEGLQSTPSPIPLVTGPVCLSMSKIIEEKTLEGLSPFKIKISILIGIFLDQDLKGIEVDDAGSWSVVWLCNHPSAFLGFHLTTSSALDATQALDRQLAEAIASQLKVLVINTAIIANRLKMLTVGGRAYWVNCSYYTSNSFILHFGDLGLTLHNASIYFTLTRDYILRGPRLVFLTCAPLSQPGESMVVDPQAVIFTRGTTSGIPKVLLHETSIIMPRVASKLSNYNLNYEQFILHSTLWIRYSWISGISEMSSKPHPSTNSQIWAGILRSINSAQGDFGLGGSRIWVNIDILRSSTRPHVAWSLGLNPTRFLRELSFPLFTNPEFNRLQVLELVFRCSALRLFIQISPLTILRFSKIPASPRP
ncbi:hypothetical protein DFH09DRAFT_1291383 [Mycena vulgaris]|nr:hypothetical protein DFH09DRAFT_1291383 [Mycena vulgaris]